MNSRNFEGAPDHYEVKTSYMDEDSIHTIFSGIMDLLPFGNYRNVIIICIGTDRSTGDSLGPLIGTFLEEAGLQRFHLYGTLDEPVHAINLEEKLKQIHDSHFRPFIIAIDACLGRLKSIGDIKIGSGSVKPGAGVRKELPSVGDMHITGIVNVSGYMEFFVLQNTRLNLVMRMAKRITAGIIEADKAYAEKPKYSIEHDIEHENTAE